MTRRLERKIAERTRRPTRRHHRERSLGEGAGSGAGETNTKAIRADNGIGLELGQLEIFVRRTLGPIDFDNSVGLDDHQFGIAIPAERHASDSELLGDRRLQRREVFAAERSRRGNRCLTDRSTHDLVEEALDPFGENSHLLLLQGDAHDALTVSRLEVELTFAGLADRAGDESLGLLEVEYLACHVPSLS